MRRQPGPRHTPAARLLPGLYQRLCAAIRFMKRGGVCGRRAGPRSVPTLIRSARALDAAVKDLGCPEPRLPLPAPPAGCWPAWEPRSGLRPGWGAGVRWEGLRWGRDRPPGRERPARGAWKGRAKSFPPRRWCPVERWNGETGVFLLRRVANSQPLH